MAKLADTLQPAVIAAFLRHTSDQRGLRELTRVAGPIRVGIAGALGRMGHAVAAAVDARADAQICAVYDRPGSEGQLAEHEGARERVLVTRDQALAYLREQVGLD